MISKDAQIEILRKALISWMIEHGHRCQICSERTQNALKGIDIDIDLEHEGTYDD